MVNIMSPQTDCRSLGKPLTCEWETESMEGCCDLGFLERVTEKSSPELGLYKQRCLEDGKDKEKPGTGRRQ